MNHVKLGFNLQSNAVEEDDSCSFEASVSDIESEEVECDETDEDVHRKKFLIPVYKESTILPS